MRSSRAPEIRGGSRGPLVIGIALVVVVLTGVAIAFTVGGFGSLSAESEPVDVPEAKSSQPAKVEASPASAGESATNRPISMSVRPNPTATPAPTTAPAAGAPSNVPSASQQAEVAPVMTLEEKQTAAMQLLPEVEFGEVIGEGFGNLKLPGGELVDVWYTFQVDTRNGEITVFMAQFDSDLKSVQSTMIVNNYAYGEDIQRAELSLYYSDGSERILIFDGSDESISLIQHYKLPFGPSMFSAPLRRELVFYGLELADQVGETTVELHLDVSGLSETEEMVFYTKAPVEVSKALAEIGYLIEQIEVQRQG